MIDPIQAAAAADGVRLSRTTASGARPPTARDASFAGELARFTSSTTGTTRTNGTTRTSATAETTATTATTATNGATAATGAGGATTGTSTGTVKAVARPDNEHTRKIAGHPYSRIENGADKGLYLNQLQGSPRVGAVFRLVERDDRVFHVYGTGSDKVVVEVKKKDPEAPAASAGGATPTTT
ncbi:MAG: hypothetical protein ACLGI5_15465 [Thermoleophilia bacterium]